MFHLAQGLSVCQIAKILGRNKSTISRELKHNNREYLPSYTQAAYHKRQKKGYVSNRGKVPISNELSARPVEANERIRLGDWELDAIVGKSRKSGLVTLVDRKSRFLLCSKLTRLGSKEVETALIETLQG